MGRYDSSKGKHGWLIWTVSRPGVFLDSVLQKAGLVDLSGKLLGRRTHGLGLGICMNEQKSRRGGDGTPMANTTAQELAAAADAACCCP